MKDIDITIDDNNNIRVLPVEKYTASQKLKGESTKFVSSKSLRHWRYIPYVHIEIIQFNDLIKSINDLIDNHSQTIENEKLKALGKRNQLYEEIESRNKKAQEIKGLIREKKEELERLRVLRESLLKIETEQRIVIEKLSNNESNE